MRATTIDLANKEQDAFIWFDNGLVTARSGRIEQSGITIEESIVADANYSSGNCNSAHCTVSIMNEDGLLSGFPYGWGEVNIGYHLSETEESAEGIPSGAVGIIGIIGGENIGVYSNNNTVVAIYSGTTVTSTALPAGTTIEGFWMTTYSAAYGSTHENYAQSMKLYVYCSDGSVYLNDNWLNFINKMTTAEFRFTDVTGDISYYARRNTIIDGNSVSMVLSDPYSSAEYTHLIYCKRKDDSKFILNRYIYLPMGQFKFSVTTSKRAKKVQISGYDKMALLDNHSAKELYDYIATTYQATDFEPVSVISRVSEFVKANDAVGLRDEGLTIISGPRGEDFPDSPIPKIGTRRSAPGDITMREWVSQACRALGGNMYFNGIGGLNYYSATCAYDFDPIGGEPTAAMHTVDSEYVINESIEDGTSAFPYKIFACDISGNSGYTYGVAINRNKDGGTVVVSGNYFLGDGKDGGTACDLKTLFNAYQDYYRSQTVTTAAANYSGYRGASFELDAYEIGTELGDWFKYDINQDPDDSVWVCFPLMQRTYTWGGFLRCTISATIEQKWDEEAEGVYSYDQQISELNENKSTVTHATIAESSSVTLTLKSNTYALMNTRGANANQRGLFRIYKQGNSTQIVADTIIAANQISFTTTVDTITIANANSSWSATLDMLIFNGEVTK